MTLPASGAISLATVNTELGLSSTATISMNDAAVRNLFGVASGAISMSNGHGKSAQDFRFTGSSSESANVVTINPDGTITFDNGWGTTLTKYWLQPVVVGQGAGAFQVQLYGSASNNQYHYINNTFTSAIGAGQTSLWVTMTTGNFQFSPSVEYAGVAGELRIKRISDGAIIRIPFVLY